MNRRERIVFLLENYLDVEHGIQEARSGQGDFIPQMCRAYRHPSYRELRRLLAIMQYTDPTIFRDLAATYFQYDTVRRAICPRCLKEYPPGTTGFHKHGQKAIALIDKPVKRPPRRVDPLNVELAIDWLTDQFSIEPFIPDELLVFAA